MSASRSHRYEIHLTRTVSAADIPASLSFHATPTHHARFSSRRPSDYAPEWQLPSRPSTRSGWKPDVLRTCGPEGNAATVAAVAAAGDLDGARGLGRGNRELEVPDHGAAFCKLRFAAV